METKLPDWATNLQRSVTFRPFDFKKWFEDHKNYTMRDFAHDCGMTEMGVRKAIIRGTLHYNKTLLKMEEKYPNIKDYFID